MTTMMIADKTGGEGEWYTLWAQQQQPRSSAMTTLAQVMEEVRVMAPREQREVARQMCTGELHQRWLVVVPGEGLSPQWFLRDRPLLRGDFLHVAAVLAAETEGDWYERGKRYRDRQLRPATDNGSQKTGMVAELVYTVAMVSVFGFISTATVIAAAAYANY